MYSCNETIFSSIIIYIMQIENFFHKSIFTSAFLSQVRFFLNEILFNLRHVMKSVDIFCVHFSLLIEIVVGKFKTFYTFLN